MSNEGFLRRWSRLKEETASEPPAIPEQERDRVPAPQPAAAAPQPVAAAAPQPGAAAAPVTLDDVARLGPESDYSAFVARGVDKAVRRLALKKLFADPRFNVMDGLDIYMGDYNKADPVAPGMLASLRQAQGFLAKLAEQDEAQAEADAQVPPSHEGLA